MDSMLLNGKPRCTLIQRLDRSFVLVGPNGKEKLEHLASIGEVEAEVEKRGWVIGLVHPNLTKAIKEE